jgi:hypothetical protein
LHNISYCVLEQMHIFVYIVCRNKRPLSKNRGKSKKRFMSVCGWWKISGEVGSSAESVVFVCGEDVLVFLGANGSCKEAFSVACRSKVVIRRPVSGVPLSGRSS